MIIIFIIIILKVCSAVSALTHLTSWDDTLRVVLVSLWLCWLGETQARTVVREEPPRLSCSSRVSTELR